MYKWIKKIGFFLGIVAVVALLAILLLPPMLGWKNLVVLSDSMEPSLKKYDLICVKPCELSETSVGDIITFYDRNGISTTHRVIGFVEGKAITKGDANEIADAEEVDDNHLIGRVVLRVPQLGRMAKK